MKTPAFLFVTTHFVPDYHYGGVVESGNKLYKYLMRLGNFKLSTVSRNPSKVREYLRDSDRCYHSIWFHRFAFSIDAILGLWKDIRDNEVLLINGIFTFPVTLAAFYAVVLKKPFIVASRGGLEPWSAAHKKWKKFFYIRLVTLPLMRKARYIHVTSAQEEKNIRALGFNNTINITNGIDLDEFRELPDKAAFGQRYEGRFVFLFMSRTDKLKAKLWVRHNIWNKLPLFARSPLYFLYRYFFKLGFLDGQAGFIYCFLHAFWYQALIDIMIIEKSSGANEQL